MENNITPGLQSLMGVALQSKINWHDDDLADLLLHQLQTPLLCDLRADAGQLVELKDVAEMVNWNSLQTFADLLQHPNPPTWLLRLAKDFAKEVDGQFEGSLPPPIASALYYACIACALVRAGVRITVLDDSALRQGFGWVKQQSWIHNAVRTLAEEATALLENYP